MGSCCSKQPVSKKRKQIPKKLRNEVWETYHKTDTGPCYSCGVQLKRTEVWHCSHVKSHAKGGETSIENLRTCCVTCNLKMGNKNMYSYILENHLKGPGAKNAKKYLNKNKT